MNQKASPPRQLSVVAKLKSAYILWQEHLKHFPKTSKYTLGEKIDSLFLKILELILLARFADNQQKVTLLTRAITSLDLAKFFLQLAWESKSLNTEKYSKLSEYLDEVGRMLGGWRKTAEQKTSRR